MESTFAQVRDRLHNRRFAVANNTQGLSGTGTVFHYQVEDVAITSTYQKVAGPDTIELLYNCITNDGDILAGWSRGRVESDDAGRTTLHFVWGWLSGAVGGGESNYVGVEATGALAD